MLRNPQIHYHVGVRSKAPLINIRICRKVELICGVARVASRLHCSAGEFCSVHLRLPVETNIYEAGYKLARPI